MSETTSPVYPDRPIHPLPKRRLRSRVSSETAESILYPAASTSSKPPFSLPFHEPIEFVNGSLSETAGDSLASGISQGQSLGQGKTGYQFKGSDPDSDDEGADGLLRRYQAQRNGPSPLGPHSNSDGQRGGIVKYSKVPLPVSAPSPQDSVDGYDSFENTNNKKKRKIPTSGNSGGHHSSLSAEMAHMGISSNRDLDMAQPDMDSGIAHYYGTGSSAVPAASSGTGISGAGRGRYGRGATRTSSGRSPLGISTNGSNALQAGRQLLQKQGFPSAGQQSTKDSASHPSSDQGIISAAIANAVSLPSAALRGQENVSLLEQQASKKPASSKTQFTFTCESDSGKSMAWQEQPPVAMANPVYHAVPTSNLPTPHAIQQNKDFATQGTQTSPNMAASPNNETLAQGAANQQAQQQTKKPRRSLTKKLAIAARQRRLQQEYDNYHHPPAPEDSWICEFCEYEMIFGSPPEALIRQYEIKDRQERRRLAEKRRLLEKAKMKGRKGKKGTKNAAKNTNAGNPPQQPASKQRHEQHLDGNPTHNQGTQSENYVGEGHDEDPPPIPDPLPQTPTRIPQPIMHNPPLDVEGFSLDFDFNPKLHRPRPTRPRSHSVQLSFISVALCIKGGNAAFLQGWIDLWTTLFQIDRDEAIVVEELVIRTTGRAKIQESEWVHDRYDDDSEARAPTRGPFYARKDRHSPDKAVSSHGAKLRVDNLHYDLTEEDLEGLFTRIGPINSLALRFDRAGRSSGTAYVTYQHLSDARLAIREFDGANAHGQPIHLTLLPVALAHDPRGRTAPVRNPFDTVERPSRSLFERIDDPRFGSGSRTRGGRSRSRSPGKPRRSDVSKPAPDGVDRYVPPPAGRSRSRSRSPRRRADVGGRRRGGRERRGGRNENSGARPRKTQEELDKEMEDYWGPAAGHNESDAAATAAPNGVAASTTPATAGDEDIDMGVE
ncbi:MAG: hypothetical protein Q9211_000997 [Gyalolechia sp. 1 TL-2023]